MGRRAITVPATLRSSAGFGVVFLHPVALVTMVRAKVIRNTQQYEIWSLEQNSFQMVIDCWLNDDW